MGKDPLNAELEALREQVARLRESERQYRHIVETALEGIWILDAQDRTRFVNGRMAEMLGYTKAEMIGAPLLDFMDEEGRAIARAKLQERRQGVREQHDFRFRRKDGTDLWAIVSTHAIFDDDGRYEGALGMITDITQRKTSEETLRRSEDRYRTVSEFASDWIYWRGPEGDMRYVSPACQDVTGYSPDEFHASPGLLDEVVLPEDRHVWQGHCHATGHEKRHEPKVFRIVTKDGQIRWISHVCRPVFDRQGRFLGTRASNRVVTELKEAEQALRQTNELLERVFDTTHILVAFMDADFNFLRVNRAYAESDDRTPEFFVGKNHFDIYPHPENEVIFREVVASGQPRSFYAKPFEYAGHPERGVTYWDWTLHPVKPASGQVEGVLLCLVNVTEREQAQGQLRQRQADLAHVSRLSTIGEMTSSLAHEINQPLAAIANYAQAWLQAIRSGRLDAEELREDVTQIAAQAERAGQIVRRVRSFIRKEDTQRTRVDIADLVREAADLAEVETREYGVVLRLELDGATHPVVADAIQIEQVILNLVRNALEAMKHRRKKERKLSIRTAAVDDGCVEVAVRDSGTGLSADHQADRLFEPFFTTKPEGMGMGLAISRTIVEAHGGRLWASGNPDHGMTFRFTLPAAQGEQKHAD
ncbi:MAG TPA: PAS domain S-box protein [Phycisphaerae bacterium]|nr:PAS domain S-box protein [Phycisphaerae bacterium]